MLHPFIVAHLFACSLWAPLYHVSCPSQIWHQKPLLLLHVFALWTQCCLCETLLGDPCSAGVSLAHPRYVLVGFPSGPSLPHVCAGILSGTSLNTTFLRFSRSIWSTPVFPAASQLEGLYAFSGMNPISVRTGKILQHIGASQEILKMIQSFLLQQKLTQKSLGRLAQVWLARAKAPWAILARLRRQRSCFLPHLALPCLAFPSCLHCTFQNALCQNTPVRLHGSRMLLLYPPWGSRQAPLMCLCHAPCPGQGALHPSFRRISEPGFLHFTESQCRAQRVKGLAQGRAAGECRGRLLACPSVLQTQSPSTPPHGLAVLSHPASCTFLTF